ncbi:hypothetical protein HGRIS_014244 [Hohenbuehelia grisea]|uniref:Uncharacterized protein n=1 Tax=Hohenbuehelia grisea TaxID=104357 RepID=A0ABR3JUI7_9AGAR
MKLTSSFLLAALCAIQFAAASPAELPYGHKEEPPCTRTQVVEVTETVNPPVRPPPVTRTVTATERITITVTRQAQCTAGPPPPPPPPPPPANICKQGRLVTVYQYYNPKAEDHYYTTDPNLGGAWGGW